MKYHLLHKMLVEYSLLKQARIYMLYIIYNQVF